MYKKINTVLKHFFTEAQIYQHLFNWSPMYKRTTGKVISVSKNLYVVKIKIPITFKNKNYVGSIFGGSLFAATDPIYMIQLISILGENYVVWDKDGFINYKRPARETVFAQFVFLEEEIIEIKNKVAKNGEYVFKKTLNIVDNANQVIAEVSKTMYVADKLFYQEKRRQKTAIK